MRPVIGEHGIDARIVECVRHLRRSEGARQRHGEHLAHVQREVRECPWHAILCQQCMTLGAAGAQPLQLVFEQRGQRAIRHRALAVDEREGARGRLLQGLQQHQ